MTKLRVVAGDRISHDLRECVDRISADVDKGEAVGMVYGLLYRGGEYVCDTAGSAYRNNTNAMAVSGILLLQLQMKEMGL